MFSRVCQPWPPPCFHKHPLQKELVDLGCRGDAISTGEIHPARPGCARGQGQGTGDSHIPSPCPRDEQSPAPPQELRDAGDVSQAGGTEHPAPCHGRWSEKKLRSHSQAMCPSSQSVGATARFQPVVMEVTTLFPGPAIFVTFLGLFEASWGPVPQHSGTATSLSAQPFQQLPGGRTSWERGSLSPYRHQSDFSSCSGGPEQKGRVSERETPNTPGVPTSISPAHQPRVMVLHPVGPGGRPGSAPCPHCPTAGAGSGPHPALPDRVPAEGAVTFVSWALLCVQPGLRRGMEESLSLCRLAEGTARVSAHPSACKSCQELCRAAYLNPKSFFSY